MDLAITQVSPSRQVPVGPGAAPDERWDVLCLHHRRGTEVAQRLATFGHRYHAEAFVSDLLAGRAPGHSADGPRPT